MPDSTTTLTIFRDRIREFLQDTGETRWTDNVLDECIEIALIHMTRISPIKTYTDITPTNKTITLTSTSYHNILKMCYPYLPTTPLRWVDYHIIDKNNYYVNIDIESGQTLRVFHTTNHELNGLNSAVNTTFDLYEENLLVLGAAGHACASRSVALNEVAISRTTSTPNYGVLSQTLLSRFENGFQLAT